LQTGYGSGPTRREVFSRLQPRNELIHRHSHIRNNPAQCRAAWNGWKFCHRSANPLACGRDFYRLDEHVFNGRCLAVSDHALEVRLHRLANIGRGVLQRIAFGMATRQSRYIA
jgi:hypothetical protein